MPKTVQLSPRLQQLFSATKHVCFGRYALAVPKEAQITWGSVSFPSKIEVYPSTEGALRLRVESDIAKLRMEDSTSEVTYSQNGPVANSWQFRYYESRFAKAEGLHFFNTYIDTGESIFRLRGSVRESEIEDAAAARETARAKSLRWRAPDEAPPEPGFCIERGFLRNMDYSDQEIINIGIHFPSLPDVSFSVSSNKDAYADYSSEEFEQTKRHELSLLARIQQAKDEQGVHYPSRTVLREGKRDVQHWQGEESLIKRKDGTHDFEWALVGKPRDVANPAEFGAQMYTKVEHNTVGAAKAASLSDDEAVALWDKLLSGLKFRTKVPGAPLESYYFPIPDNKGGVAK